MHGNRKDLLFAHCKQLCYNLTKLYTKQAILALKNYSFIHSKQNKIMYCNQLTEKQKQVANDFFLELLQQRNVMENYDLFKETQSVFIESVIAQSDNIKYDYCMPMRVLEMLRGVFMKFREFELLETLNEKEAQKEAQKEARKAVQNDLNLEAEKEANEAYKYVNKAYLRASK